MYTSTRQAAQLFSVNEQTVRRWIDEFSALLSPAATPESGRRRVLTDKDMEVVALVAEMKEQGKTFEEIHAALQAGQRGAVPESDSPQQLATPAHTELVFLVQRVRNLEKDLEAERTKRIQAEVEKGRAEGRESVLREMLEQTQRELNDLRNKLQK
jgi:DNA-binding transcriptional MerR regulator